jgi:hypothetical protein
MRRLIYSMGVSLDGFIAGPLETRTFGSRVLYVRYRARRRGALELRTRPAGRP